MNVILYFEVYEYCIRSSNNMLIRTNDKAEEMSRLPPTINKGKDGRDSFFLVYPRIFVVLRIPNIATRCMHVEVLVVAAVVIVNVIIYC